MNDLFLYPTEPSTDRPAPKRLPKSAMVGMRDPSGYLRNQDLTDAVNVALALMQPLLLTGAPGVGKSELAYSIAYEMGLDAPLTFETKSTSQARDLFYTFDTLGRFADSQSREPSGSHSGPAVDYITYNALGQAILNTLDPSNPVLSQALPQSQKHIGKRRSVVLIDEVEKAPRDLPNDILNEIDRMFFRIPELGNIRVDADPDLAPIVVITSNSESSLPDAFLRRCVYYHIPFPDKPMLEKIVLTRLGGIAEEMPAVREAVNFILRLQEPDARLEKAPSTAELLNWLAAVVARGGDLGQSLRGQPMARRCLTALSKLSHDQVVMAEAFEDWLGS